MHEQVQQALESALHLMQEAANRRMGSGLAGTRVLQSLLVVVAKQCLTEEQQQQVEKIVDLHDTCMAQRKMEK